MRAVRRKGLGTPRTYTMDFYWEKCNRKTTEFSKLESSGTDMFVRAKTARNLSILVTFHVLGFKQCTCHTHTKSFPLYVSHVMSLSDSLVFLGASLDSWEDPGYKAMQE